MVLLILDLIVAVILSIIAIGSRNAAKGGNTAVTTVVRNTAATGVRIIIIPIAVITTIVFLLLCLIFSVPVFYVCPTLVPIALCLYFGSEQATDQKRQKATEDVVNATKQGVTAVGNGVVTAGKAVGNGVATVGKAVASNEVVQQVAKDTGKAAGTLALAGAAVATGPVGTAVIVGSAAEYNHAKKKVAQNKAIEAIEDKHGELLEPTDEVMEIYIKNPEKFLEKCAKLGINTNGKTAEEVAATVYDSIPEVAKERLIGKPVDEAAILFLEGKV